MPLDPTHFHLATEIFIVFLNNNAIQNTIIVYTSYAVAKLNMVYVVASDFHAKASKSLPCSDWFRVVFLSLMCCMCDGIILKLYLVFFATKEKKM